MPIIFVCSETMTHAIVFLFSEDMYLHSLYLLKLEFIFLSRRFYCSTPEDIESFHRTMSVDSVYSRDYTPVKLPFIPTELFSSCSVSFQLLFWVV